MGVAHGIYLSQLLSAKGVIDIAVMNAKKIPWARYGKILRKGSRIDAVPG